MLHGRQHMCSDLQIASDLASDLASVRRYTTQSWRHMLDVAWRVYRDWQRCISRVLADNGRMHDGAARTRAGRAARANTWRDAGLAT